MSLYEFTDEAGELRRCGTIPETPEIPVGAAVEEQAGFQVWTDSQIKDVVTDPRRSNRIEVMRKAGFLTVFTKKANQFQSSACNGWLDANAYTLSRWFGGNRDGTVYSGAYNYSLINGGRDAGSSLAAGFRTTTENGYVPVELCPWNMIYRKDTKQFDTVAAQNKAVDPFPARTMAGFRTGMAQGFIGGAAIQVGPNLERKTSSGIAPVDRGPGNHAVAILQVRFIGSTRVYDCYLDWGPQHGHDGFLTLTDEHFEDTFNNHLHWLMPVGQWGG